MATDHADDPRFVERVVSGKAFVLGDFQLVETQRPLQAIKKVLTGEAECALVDDAQMAELPHRGRRGHPFGLGERQVPSMTLVAFGSDAAGARKKFSDGLSRVCDGEGKTRVSPRSASWPRSAADAGGYAGRRWRRTEWRSAATITDARACQAALRRCSVARPRSRSPSCGPL